MKKHRFKDYIKNYFKGKIDEIKAYGKKNIIIRLITIFVTILFACLVLTLAKESEYYKNTYNIEYTEREFKRLERVKIIEVIKEEENNNSGIAYTVHIVYKAVVLEGDNKGKECVVHQYLNDYTEGYTNKVKGNKVVYAALQETVTDELSYLFNGDSLSFDHIGGLIALAVILIILLLVISKTKGLLTIISLILSLLSVLYIFLPRLINGNNIYLLTIFVCIFTIVVTYLLVVGVNKKCLCAVLGCFAGLMLSGALSFITMYMIDATGHFSNETVSDDITLLYQTLYNVDIRIDLKGIIFASTLIGALGAVMDVSLSLSSSLKEVYDNAKENSVLSTIKSGFNIGKDMIGTMVNTLILAYIASDLAFILYIMVHHSTEFILRSEFIAIAVAQALVGSIAMVLTIPLTSLICALIYNKKNKIKTEEGEN